MAAATRIDFVIHGHRVGSDSHSSRIPATPRPAAICWSHQVTNAVVVAAALAVSLTPPAVSSGEMEYSSALSESAIFGVSSRQRAAWMKRSPSGSARAAVLRGEASSDRGRNAKPTPL
jgi:hypothetical protein